eukprot:CAMPEP_0170564518 /NCGR_PEP_ID=MMETSP0211-20121228/73322_1 /TAXON_ID=311385 /ORGANISM="Pseudokeronopsis sp., Strain OXSARD2" /LENGTH=52 /DNA_ID=CAMNT_0010884065 /DNA_START=18 /DNA_END=172 /DNA_ORIENTATION=-
MEEVSLGINNDINTSVNDVEEERLSNEAMRKKTKKNVIYLSGSWKDLFKIRV